MDRFVDATRAIVTGNGLDSGSTMGALANPRRTAALTLAVEDAAHHGGKLRTGGQRTGTAGNFFAPTVVTEVDRTALAMNINHVGLGLPEVPFGGVKDSGYGSEGGTEAIEPYLNPKFISQMGA